MATFTVTTLADENDGNLLGDVSLREAIEAANTTPGADTIVFLPGLSGTITLENGELLITESVTITGLGASNLTVDADDGSRVFNIDDNNDIVNQIVEISGLTITGGSASNDGGGLFNAEDLTLSDVVVEGNVADDDGGGIANGFVGFLTLEQSTISGNSASDDGGGIVNYGVLTATNSQIENNTAGEDGGGIDNEDLAIATLSNSTVSNNTATNNGGGIYNDYDALLDVTQSTIADNSANRGGGLFNGDPLVTIISNSTIRGNSATNNGGGIVNRGGYFPLYVNNSTISGNSAGTQGGGIENTGFSSSIIQNATITNNSANIGGGINNRANATTELSNSLVSGNTASTANEIRATAAGTISADANNLFGHGGESDADAFVNFATGMDDINATSDGTNVPLATIRGPLANNGGPTQTHGLPTGSPAIDAGDNNNVPPDDGDQDNDNNIFEDVPFDQRGTVARITDGDGDGTATIDIGAYEECFLTGTHILTDNGEIPVELLKIGDRVQTADGTLEPIKWIGRQTREPQQVRNPLRSHPIHIKAGALGNGLPRRDLFVSPDHALLFDGLLINAGALVNGTSILKTTPTETFTYYHIELDQHALLVAEGTAAESYLPQKEDRLVYDNGAEYEELYPHGNKIILWPLDYPRISSHGTVPRYIRKQLIQIANTIGLGKKVA